MNGPGEMADADFGYVGGAPGKINLYVGKQPIKFNIPELEAVDRLVDLIKEHNKWVEPEAQEIRGEMILSMSRDDQRARWTKPAYTWFCALSPILVLFAFVTLAMHTRFAVGYWPNQSVDNARSISFLYWLHTGVFLATTGFAVLVAIPVWLCCLFVPSLRLSIRTHAIQSLSYGIGWGLFFLLAVSAPAQWITWFLD